MPAKSNFQGNNNILIVHLQWYVVLKSVKFKSPLKGTSAICSRKNKSEEKTCLVEAGPEDANIQGDEESGTSKLKSPY